MGIAGAALVLGARRRIGALLAAVSFAGIVDEAQNGPRLVRRAVRRRRTTVNVVARAGKGAAALNNNGGPASDGRETAPGGREIDTLVVLAHHDAPQTGFIFDQTLQRRLHELFQDNLLPGRSCHAS